MSRVIGVGLSPTHQPCASCGTRDSEKFGPVSDYRCRRCLRAHKLASQKRRDLERLVWAREQGLPQCTVCDLFDRTAALSAENPWRQCGMCRQEAARGVDLAIRNDGKRQRVSDAWAHGTAARYRGQGCRCQACREAHAVWMRSVRERAA